MNIPCFSPCYVGQKSDAKKFFDSLDFIDVYRNNSDYTIKIEDL